MLAHIFLLVATLTASAGLAQTVDTANTTVGNVRPETHTDLDQGPLNPARHLNHLVIRLRPLEAAQTALEDTVRALHNPASPTFHHWLTPSDVSAQLAIPDSQIAAVNAWLESHNLQVNAVDPTRTSIDFSGTVAQIQAAFHTKIHRFLSAAGETHFANLTSPVIPSELAPLVVGVVALHDYRPYSQSAPIRVVPDILLSSGYQNVGPGDLEVIYNIGPLHAAGISGQGQTIAVLETSDMYSIGDWLAYRKVFGLAKKFPQGQLIVSHPTSASHLCTPPGIVTADREATLDAEVATAAAPNATVIVASCANTNGDSGLNIALANLLNTPNPPAVISISYGNAETLMSQAQRDEINMLYLQAAAQGISIFVSSGDGGADGYYTDRGTPGIHGISSSGLASTEWNVAVGGTDFEDTYFGVVPEYWSAVNTPAGRTALSYVPEIAWNGSCASQLFATFNGFAHAYGSDGYCNSPTVPSVRLTGLTGSGGPSTCATGYPAVSGVTGGTCVGRPKPAWQAGLLGVPTDGVRDLPDLSLFAAAGDWFHGYAICFSDPTRSGQPCLNYFGISGGTSAASPLMAAIQLLVNQNTGQSWGNPDSIYYSLARNQYGSAGSPSCNASLGNAVSADCIFHDITQGDNVVTCTPNTPNCYAPSGAIGVLSLSTSSYQPAYNATTGWDFATGIGSVNAANLVNHWSEGVAALTAASSQ